MYAGYISKENLPPGVERKRALGQRRKTKEVDVARRNPWRVSALGMVTLLVPLTLLFLWGCSIPPRGGQPSLQTNIGAPVFSPILGQVIWGILVVDPERENPLYSLNAHKKFVPASNMKLLPTATALNLLGPEYRYTTELWGVGTLEEESGVLSGDLVLRGSGDPTLSKRFYPSDEAPLDSLAQGLWETGVRAVEGSLVVDVSAWDSTTVPGAWMVQNLAGTSSATGGAFALAEGVLSIEVTGGSEPGTPAEARWWPRVGSDLVSAHFTTVDPDSARRARRIHYRPESGRLRIEGRVRVGEVDTIRVSQREPVRMATQALRLALERKGIEIHGGLRIAWDPGDLVGPGNCVTGRPGVDTTLAGPFLPDCPGSRRLATLSSPEMAQIVKAILEPSQNWMADQLVRTLAAESGLRGSWREGFQVQRRFLVDQVGVDSLDLNFEDGSGMSPYNLVTPRAIVAILDFMRRSELHERFQDALAGPGEEDSTLRNRLRGLEGKVFAKTGTLSHVTSLSGYVITESGRELTFAILSNNSGLPSRLVREGIDEIVTAMARW
jgi:D-alanyl-D-alanine carboxypeptidase/D-alanyl-D-alanine-endopeptidase (penicillin-binding protein 4)